MGTDGCHLIDPSTTSPFRTLGNAAETVAVTLYTKDSHFVMELIQNGGRSPPHGLNMTGYTELNQGQD